MFFGSGNDVGYEFPMIGLDVPVQLDEGLVAVGTHLLQGLPLVNPLYVDPQIESGTRFILTLVTLEVFYFLMNNPKMSQKGSFFLKQLVTMLARKLWLINSSLVLGNVALVGLEMPLQIFG